MTEITLAQALGGVLAIPQFFVYRLTWSPEESKYLKTPCYANGVPLGKDEGGQHLTDYITAVTNLARLRERDGNNAWTLGWYFTADCGYWFLDVDGCVDGNGELTQEAAYFFQALPGAFCEWSSSGRGLHFIGRGPVPEHSCTYKLAKLELYTEGRGIAFGLTGMATGSADTDHTAAIAIIAGHWFKPLVIVDAGTGPRPEWRGPTDDNELLRRAMQSDSAGSLLGTKANFADLWQRNVSALVKTYPPGSIGKEFGESEADQALAFQLAFWTGCDAPRIERLMRQSKLYRTKWEPTEHETYLAKTISMACSGVSRVLVDKEKVQALAVATTEEQKAASSNWMQRVMQAEEAELRDTVIPGIAADGSIDMLDRDRLASMVQDRLKVFQIPATINQCRKMVQLTNAKPKDGDIGVPQFALDHVYIEQGDLFFNISDATECTRTTFQAKFNRGMPTKNNGDKEDAARWCLERWNMPTVHDAMYLPGRETIFTHQGRTFANLYSVASLPALAINYTEAGVLGITNFALHLERFCGRRPDVYGFILAWMAFNVQNPGQKIRFAPILKGVPGDGKSILTSVMAAAMGERNVSSVGPSVVMNSGGFTDWAHGACVIGMEELKMDGKTRHAMANAFKDNVTNSRVTINRKGKGNLKIINISNFVAYTNFVDAVPLEDNDRRWYVVFSPYCNSKDVAEALGLSDADQLGAFFDTIWHAVHHCPGEIRRWLLEMPIPDWFKPNGHAPDTPEKQMMRASGEDEDHAIARQVIATGAYGVCSTVVSSACLTVAMRSLCISESVDVPKGVRLNKLLVDTGFIFQGFVKWQNKSHRVWALSAMTTDQMRYHLDTTVTEVTVPPPL